MKNRYKILHLCHGLFGGFNGIDRFIKIFTEELEHDHFVAFPRAKNENFLNESVNLVPLDSLEELPGIIENLNIDFLIIHWNGGESFIGEDIVKFKDKYISLSGQRFTIDYSPFSYVDFLGLFHPDEKKHKTIIITHTTYQLPEYMNIINCDAIVHVSHAAYDSNKEILNRHYVIYPGLEQSLLNEPITIKSDKVRIGWLGRMNKYDNDAYKFLKENYGTREDLIFIFAGKGDLDDTPPENFIFTGNIQPEEFFKNIDIFLYPTKIDSFSLSLLEAMSQAKPCIVSSIVSELAKIGNAFIYDKVDKNHTYLKLALDTLIEFKGFRKLQGQLSKHLVSKNFSPEVFRNNFDNLMNYLSTEIKNGSNIQCYDI